MQRIRPGREGNDLRGVQGSRRRNRERNGAAVRSVGREFSISENLKQSCRSASAWWWKIITSAIRLARLRRGGATMASAARKSSSHAVIRILCGVCSRLEVSEIADGTVEIRGIAREAGYRTKIAVWSANDKVDPVGACVGMRGSRVKNIVRELNNEKVDIIRWSSDPKEFVLEALKPAKVKNLTFDTEKRA